MSIDLRMRSALALGIVSAASLCTPCAAQSFPTGPVRFIVPFAAGGTSDILARQIAPKLSEALGQPVLVENRAGANGNVGAEVVARATPDGQTLLLADLGAIAINPSVYKQSYDPVRDLVGVTMVAYSPHLLVVHPSVPVRTVKELIALARSRPGQLNFATSGVGGPPHLAGVAFAQATGSKWAFIPYKGGAAALIDVAGGHADLTFNGMLATFPYVKGGRLRLVAVSGAKRYPTLPDVPTVSESGVPGFETGSWQGILAASASPRAALDRLSTDIARILNVPEMREYLGRQGAEVSTMKPEQLSAWMKTEVAKWAEVVRKGGIKLE
ncbi:MAG: tripartite tricarboxylate transporter substrate binding protein [Rhodocyclaceae bacterium]|nr:tripartite tricarboxylate transporter substrate binding protein [Rhodocyclaceae bacterium]MCA3073332.1 tripartite tricarboxylate transporter substrate binding protein [Rhodocyclaceae bacterium]MCA3091372.1 tripartite tricarboxylate transporter substrate binding protein [Rhodocyclaceae bacterium]MCA3094181.1 tripartite tricarboxylate transporter substrate binding protein [Rhodocyclaceae bacterium]MCA3098355.1 tripartite tricarboxylate transporter substrate binding protein [Rhodocyclaceae bact